MKKLMDTRRILSVVLSLAVVVTGFLFLAFFLYSAGFVHLNNPEKEFPVRGVDVSGYQGDIDWNELERQNIDFAFIKATEGSSYQDKNYASNFKNAKNTGIVIGAYHFTSFDSSGKSQAENYINTVSEKSGILPPTVDFELYGKYKNSPPSIAEAQKILKPLLSTLEGEYKVKPIIYCTENTYNLYIKDSFSAYPLWIRNVYTKPIVENKGQWTFWQYCDKGRLSGYNGSEKFIDLNVFDGNIEQLKNLVL